ncbi:MAG: pentapeptide repeat-containing protein [Spirochaetes bacterium]|nr:pentapeptide repeat-containing protein [Spirochaetota bacterium]
MKKVSFIVIAGLPAVAFQSVHSFNQGDLAKSKGVGDRNLEKADLSNANLTNANFSNATLIGVNFPGAILTNCNLLMARIGTFWKETIEKSQARNKNTVDWAGY